jgi:hypothetical protein
LHVLEEGRGCCPLILYLPIIANLPARFLKRNNYMRTTIAEHYTYLIGFFNLSKEKTV